MVIQVCFFNSIPVVVIHEVVAIFDTVAAACCCLETVAVAVGVLLFDQPNAVFGRIKPNTECLSV